MTSQKYLLVTLTCAAFLLALLCGILRYMDPVYYYGAKDRTWANAVRNGAVHYQEVSKVYSLDWYRPQTLIIGNSRSQTGLDPMHPGFVNQPVYNLAYPGANMPTTLALFQQAVAT